MPFKKGQSGNPLGARVKRSTVSTAGNPRGPNANRTLVTNKYIRAVRAAWDEYGDKVLAKLAEESPEKFVDVVANVCLLPKEVNFGGTVEHKHSHEHITLQEANRRLGELLEIGEADDVPPSLSH